MFEIGPITDALIDSCIKELKKKENKDKMYKNILDPIFQDINNKYGPYFILITTMLGLIIILMCIILIVSLMNRNK